MTMKYQFICYPRCTTCQKAEQWLKEHGIAYEVRNIKEQNPTVAELQEWHKKEAYRYANSSTPAGNCTRPWR